MPVDIANPECDPLEFAEFVALVDAIPCRDDGRFKPLLAVSALSGLARNRDFLATRIIAELKANCAGQLSGNSYGPQVILLHRGDRRFAVRANIWPAAQDAEYRENGAKHYFYGRAHDHNFDFLTVGYLGPGYVSDYYDYGEGRDNEALVGYPHEPVPLRFIERSALTQGRMLLYRACIDIHCQWPPERLSVSLNVMDATPGVRWRNQYLIDTEQEAVERTVSVAASECLLAIVVHYDDAGRDLAEQFALSHPCERMRWSATKAIASTKQSKEGRLRYFDRMTSSECRLVASSARMEVSRLEIAIKTDALSL